MLPPPDDDNLSDGAVFGDSSGDVNESESEDASISLGLCALTDSAESVYSAYDDTDSDALSVTDGHPPLSDIDVDNADNSDINATQSGLSSPSPQPSATSFMSKGKKRKRYLTAD